jgi:hypothetical protein
MPTYSFRNKETHEVFEKFMKMSEKEQYLISNPELESILGAPAMIDQTSTLKPDNGFRDLLKDIRKKHNKVWTPSTINTF